MTFYKVPEISVKDKFDSFDIVCVGERLDYYSIAIFYL